MDKVERRFRDKPGIYTVYTKEEADTEKIEYSPWRDTKEGEWGLTDDGFVMELVRKKTYADRNGYSKTFMNFSAGATWDNNTTVFEYLPRKEHKAWGVSKAQPWDTKEARKTRTKNVVKTYVRQMMSSSPIDYFMLGKMHQPAAKLPVLHMKRLLKTEGVRKLVNKEIDELLVDLGITKKFALEILMEAVESARESGRPTELLKVAQELQNLVGIKGDVQRVIQTDSIEASTKTLDLISKEGDKIEKVKLERKVDSPVEDI